MRARRIYCALNTATKSFLSSNTKNDQQMEVETRKIPFCIVFTSGLCGNVTVGLFEGKLGYYSALK